MSARRLLPSTSSMAKNGVPPSSPTSCTVTMAGWLRAATARTSFWKRTSAAESAAGPGSTLSATSRPRRRSRARYTQPMPPAPSSDITS